MIWNGVDIFFWGFYIIISGQKERSYRSLREIEREVDLDVHGIRHQAHNGSSWVWGKTGFEVEV